MQYHMSVALEKRRMSIGGMRVNCGCGPNPTPGWVNLDNSPSVRLARHLWFAKIARKLGLLASEQMLLVLSASEKHIHWANAQRLPLKSGSVDVLYSSHMVEHLDREEASAFLKEARRVLLPNGIIRLVVPDLAKLVEAYERSGDANAFIERMHVCTPHPRTLLERMRRFLVGQRNHLWMYDAASLVQLLTSSGFVGAVALLPGQTAIENPGALDLSERCEISVYVEARNPS